jgi:formylmethanofuran dehydrogenase subunit E
VPEPRKATAPPSPKEAAKEAAKPEKPPIAEGEVACDGCGASITKNQEKLSRLLTGKSLCKRCMNPT